MVGDRVAGTGKLANIALYPARRLSIDPSDASNMSWYSASTRAVCGLIATMASVKSSIHLETNQLD